MSFILKGIDFLVFWFGVKKEYWFIFKFEFFRDLDVVDF